MAYEKLPAGDYARSAEICTAMLRGSMQDTADMLDAVIDMRHFGRFAERAARRLGSAADPVGIELAVGILLSRPTARSASHAVSLLRLARATQTTPVLIRLLPHRAVDGDRPPIAALWAVFEALGAFGAQGAAAATEALIAEAVYRSTDSVPRGWSFDATVEPLVRVLARTDTEACRDVVLRLVTSAQTLWQEETLYAVARVADARFTPFFLELCAGPQWRAGLAGLLRTGSKRAVPTLVHIVRTTRDPAVRRMAARALAAVAASAQSLMCLRGCDVGVRRETAWAVGRAAAPGDRRGEMSVTNHINDWLSNEPDAIVRARLTYSAGLLGLSGAWHGLLRGLDDPSYRVRAASATALGRLTATEVIEPLERLAGADPVPCVRAAAAAALRRFTTVEP